MNRERLALSIKEAAAAAGVGRTFIYSEIREKRLVARKIGRRTLITTEALKAWLNSAPTAGQQTHAAKRSNDHTCLRTFESEGR